MPTPAQILAGLTAISVEMRIVAILWHVAAALVIAALLAGWRPPKRLAATLLTLPLLSVALFAWVYGNPFNGLVLVIVALTLGVIGLRLPEERVERARTSNVIGWGMVIFGLVYPHFLEPESSLTYLYAAPTGLVPCPSLSLVIGLTLLAGGFGSRAWSLVLAAAGLFYSVFGMARLGVMLDVGLLVGAVALVVPALRERVAERSRA